MPLFSPYADSRRYLCVLAVLLLVPDGARAQAPPVSLEMLSRASTDVVLGETVAKNSFWNEQRTKIFTEVTIKVEQQVKGAASTQKVVTIPGGRVGNMLYEVSDMPVFVEGEAVLLFLWRDPRGHHLVTGAAQGKLRVVTDAKGNRVLEPGAARLMHDVAFALPNAPLQIDGTALDAAPDAPAPPVTLDAFLKAMERFKEQ